jgi:hypothetical protein
MHRYCSLAAVRFFGWDLWLLTKGNGILFRCAQARELGSLIAVDGGRYIDAAGNWHRAKLFIGPDRLWVLDPALQVLLEIPLFAPLLRKDNPYADLVFLRSRLDAHDVSAQRPVAVIAIAWIFDSDLQFRL